MARGSGDGGWGLLAGLAGIVGAGLLVTENQRRVELERMVEVQGQRIRSLEAVEKQLRQTIAQKGAALAQKDTELTKVRRERDELARTSAAKSRT